MTNDSIMRTRTNSSPTDERPWPKWIEQGSPKPKLSGRIQEEAEFVVTRRVATLVDWLFAPEWLTVEQACGLSGWDPETMQEIIGEDGVDLNHAGLIHKQSLLEFQETLAEVLHWDDD